MELNGSISEGQVWLAWGMNKLSNIDLYNGTKETHNWRTGRLKWSCLVRMIGDSTFSEKIDNKDFYWDLQHGIAVCMVQ